MNQTFFPHSNCCVKKGGRMRKPRQLKKNAYYHVSNKFHRIVQIIMCDRIKKYLLALIHAAAKKFKMKIKNICILDTHFHMEIQPGEDENLSEIMKYIKQRFTQWINRTFDSEGSAWKDRFFSRIIEDLTDLVRVFVYIEQNVIRAGLGKRAADYPFYEVWEVVTEREYYPTE